MKKSELGEMTEKVKKVMERYRVDFPDVKMDRDYIPFKITEEWGECLQVYLMLTDRGRQKGKSKEEIKEMLSHEFADVFAYLLLFAESEGIDPIEAVTEKWFAYLKKE
ncbi:MAG: pyrophosphatase [Candidatus Paceibacterota bacterium]|jgi:NTP pyrophosphatase (non-canonical NTP hydrolase)